MHNSAAHIHVIQPEAIQTADITLLNATELTHAKKLIFAKDKTLYIAAHIFLRKLLSQYAPLSPDKWCFTSNSYGKPFVSNTGYEWLQFNLSHTPGLIACAISTTEIIGVDVERHKPLDSLESLCKYAFSSTETADILSISDTAERERRFFTYWTLKEAYIKALGLGLSLPLQQFSFIKDDHKKWKITNTEIHTVSQTKNWQFDNKLLDGFQLSVATILTGPLVYFSGYYDMNFPRHF